MARGIKAKIENGKKQCSRCGEWISLENYSKYNERYNSKCKNCDKDYSKEYRNRKERKQKIKEYHREYMKNPENRKNKNAYIRKYRKNSKVKNVNTETNRKWKMKEKRKAVDYKGGKCSICGYSKCLTALEFHHIDPDEKELYNSHWKFERNKLELDKCILLCANCHREEHAKEIWYE